MYKRYIVGMTENHIKIITYLRFLNTTNIIILLLLNSSV